MASHADVSGLLAGLRVLEVSGTIAGSYADKLFAEVGADVLLAKPAGGHPLRGGRDIRGGMDAPVFTFLAADKTSTTADWTELAADTDVLIVESSDVPDRALLERLAEHIVLIAITPWGLRGPLSGSERPRTEFTLQAEARSLSHRGQPAPCPRALGGGETLWAEGSFAVSAGLAAVTGTLPKKT